MIEKVRINVSVDPDIPDLLIKLAGGRNSQGDYLSTLIRNLAADDATAVELAQMDNEALRLMVQGLGGRVRVVEAELLRMQTQLAAMIADRSK